MTVFSRGLTSELILVSERNSENCCTFTLPAVRPLLSLLASKKHRLCLYRGNMANYHCCQRCSAAVAATAISAAISAATEISPPELLPPSPPPPLYHHHSCRPHHAVALATSNARLSPMRPPPSSPCGRHPAAAAETPVVSAIKSLRRRM